mmetsp:Transcript_10437/g.27652  ORF Transcript_10437/g.27652 Transcript_10437/m.27652 type:complete len:206 (-) Transcript_10437:33-650(-)
MWWSARTQTSSLTRTRSAPRRAPQTSPSRWTAASRRRHLSSSTRSRCFRRRRPALLGSQKDRQARAPARRKEFSLGRRRRLSARNRQGSVAIRMSAQPSGRKLTSAAAAGSRRRRSWSSMPQTSAGSACQRRRTTWRLAFAVCAICAPRAEVRARRSRARARFNQAERPAGAASCFQPRRGGVAAQLASRLPGVLWCAGAPRNVN